MLTDQLINVLSNYLHVEYVFVIERMDENVYQTDNYIKLNN